MSDYKIFRCDCQNAFHTIQISRWDEDTDEILFTISSSNGITIWQRIKWAFCYIFLYQDVTYADVILRHKEASELVKFLKSKLAKRKENNE